MALIFHNLTPAHHYNRQIQVYRWPWSFTISPQHTTTTGKYRFTGGPGPSQSHPRTPLQQTNTGLQVALVLHNLTPAHHYNRQIQVYRWPWSFTISPPHTTTTDKYRFTGGPGPSQSHPSTPLQQTNTGLQVALVLHNLTPAHHCNKQMFSNTTG